MTRQCVWIVQYYSEGEWVMIGNSFDTKKEAKAYIRFPGGTGGVWRVQKRSFHFNDGDYNLMKW